MEEYKYCIEQYEISNFGNCRRKLYDGSYKQIDGSINNRGYKYFQLRREEKRINYLYRNLKKFILTSNDTTIKSIDDVVNHTIKRGKNTSYL